MRRDIPPTGSPVLDSMIKLGGRLVRQVEHAIIPPPPPQPAPADMNDKELHSAIYNIGAELLNRLGPVIQGSFARYGYDLNDRRFKHPITITVRGHVLTMSTDANDAYGLAITGLNRHAHASALAPIRLILETLAWLSWLVEDPDEKVRRARAYRLAMNASESYRRVGQTYNRVAPNSAEAAEINSRLAAACDRMKRELLDLAAEDGVTIAPDPGSLSKLAEQYLSDHGGYMTYAILSSAGAHASAVHGFLFYGDPETGFADYAFKGMFDRRAYWTAVAISLYLGICDLAAAELGWPDWDATAAAARRQFGPLADEAEKRYTEPLRRAFARLSD